ncbi:MAG TPA: helix-turn-helix transcriptional regulator [Candidatus Thermoplasmatota archaeon]|nr:helix-turn-helix transcriptional regulator [Candidatus Thermoplasmatota archaeon]
MAEEEGGMALLGDTRAWIVDVLLEGAKTTHQLADILKIHHTAVRAHLEGLERNGLVVAEFRNEGVGRPKKYYSLTEDGRELLPRRYQLMLEIILQNLLRTQGREEVESLMRAVARDLAGKLKVAASGSPLGDRVQKAVDALNELGFRASVSHEDGQLTIVRTSCVFQKTAASHHDLVCQVFDQELLNASLAGDARIELVQSQAKGDCVCKHVVQVDRIKAAPAAAP